MSTRELSDVEHTRRGVLGHTLHSRGHAAIQAYAKHYARRERQTSPGWKRRWRRQTSVVEVQAEDGTCASACEAEKQVSVQPYISSKVCFVPTEPAGSPAAADLSCGR